MASTSTNIPLSEILRSKASEEDDEEPKKKSREDWRKAKELEEARKVIQEGFFNFRRVL